MSTSPSKVTSDTPKESNLSIELKKSSEDSNSDKAPSVDEEPQAPSSPREEQTVEDSDDEPIITSVLTAPAGTVFADPNNFSIKHPLHNSWTMWWDSPRKKASQENWAANLNKLCDFDTVEDFWRLYNNILGASQLSAGSNFHIFKTGTEPKWEDKANKKGGKWVVNLPAKQRATKLDELWLFTLLSVIGESYGDFGDHVCGAVVSIRKGQDRIALWTAESSDQVSCVSIGKVFKQSLGFPDKTMMGYQSHSDALRRNSSFGNKPKYEV
eukprot:TRINITY_DN9235_c0_g1_i1.p1 TRINITY_DN9235_c0_g1~~TRINITY_DN9235_c0_g1_i1.p1  ORF type:complete len:269 (-),score=49.29 TRINITY_DN9235_c0_g1_i1:143-949(-)